MLEIPSSAAAAVLVIFVPTYLGVALGHMPGLGISKCDGLSNHAALLNSRPEEAASLSHSSVVPIGEFGSQSAARSG